MGRDKTAYFISDLEKIVVIDPAKTTLVPDRSSRFVRSRLFLESQWRQKIPTDAKLHIGQHAVMWPSMRSTLWLFVNPK